MPTKPLYQEAWEQQKLYNARGVYYCYNHRNRSVYLGVLAAPDIAEGVDGVKMTGHLVLSGGVKEARNIDANVEDVKRQYMRAYKGNPAMLSYADTIITG